MLCERLSKNILVIASDNDYYRMYEIRAFMIIKILDYQGNVSRTARRQVKPKS